MATMTNAQILRELASRTNWGGDDGLREAISDGIDALDAPTSASDEVPLDVVSSLDPAGEAGSGPPASPAVTKPTPKSAAAAAL